MRIVDDEANRPQNRVWCLLTRHEIRTLHEHLTEYLAHDQDDPGWHCHIESEDGRDKELTVAVYDPTGGAAADEHWARWYRDDTWHAGMFEST